MKRFFAMLFAAVLIVSMFGVVTVFAGCSISGSSEVYAGSTYKYTGKASYDGYSLLGTISGLDKTEILMDDNGSSMDAVSLSASASISVKIPSDAAVGTTYTITLSGSYDNGSSNNFSTTKTITVVQKPVSTPRPATSATATPEPTGWALAAIDVPAMEQGGQYTMQMSDDTVVPGTVLTSLKEKQGVLSVDFGTYTCTIDGAALGQIPEDFAGVDLGLTMEKDDALSTAAGGSDIYQLHFKHSGALPGRFTFRFKAEQSSPGDTVYLYYYYDASGVVEAKQACVVDDEGYITVNIYHCSSYFISSALIDGAAGVVMQPEPVAEPEPTVEMQPTEVPAATPQAEVNDTAEVTNDLTVSALNPIEQWFGIPYAPLIAALAAAMLLAMLLTMLFTRSGLFRRRPKAAAADTYFDIPAAPEREEVVLAKEIEEGTEDTEDKSPDGLE